MYFYMFFTACIKYCIKNIILRIVSMPQIISIILQRRIMNIEFNLNNVRTFMKDFYDITHLRSALYDADFRWISHFWTIIRRT